MAEPNQCTDKPIAIVGSACRFAGDVTSPSKLWDLLRQPVDVLSKISLPRFDAEKYYHPDPLHMGTSNVRHAYLLSEDHRVFDAPFFRITPVEAAAIDPQQRILLETTFEALESAGITIEQVEGSNTGVWVGLMGEDYSRSLEKDLQHLPSYFASGTARNNVSNRISYVFDLKGPSMTIDTACSSSLVAVHQAVASLRSGEVTCAIVAGANLILGPEQFIASSKLKMLSASGRSRMWDKSADGYARGDGFGVIVLKALPEAVAAGDDIECIIRETGVNQDGRTKGITMPSAAAQADLIRNTYNRAGLDLRKLSDRPQYFEAHGTGTPAGDPIEAEAINSVFFSEHAGFNRTREDPPLYVGGAKTVLGHTEGTAGILGVMKTSLALQHAAIPPNLLLRELNPRVKPFYTHLRIPQGNASLDWPGVPAQLPRRASVNSFGFGGTNAHAILESVQPNQVPGSVEDDCTWKGPPLTPFNFSAASEKSLRAGLAAYASFLRSNPSVNLRDLAWTLNTRRSTFPARASVYAQNARDLSAKLDAASLETSSVTVAVPDPMSDTGTAKVSPRIMAIFTGQGAQWVGMGKQLLRESALVELCFEQLQKSLDSLPQGHVPTWRLREELLKDAETSRITQGVFAQPLCTAIQIALVQLFKEAGIQFTAVVGHSSGEIAAAYAAGYLSAEDSIRIAYYRGFFLEKDAVAAYNRNAGAMLAVATSPEDADELCTLRSLKGKICVAAKNSPTSVTLSGDIDAIQDAEEIMEDEGKFTRRLRVDRAYHSHHMRDYALDYVKALEDVHISPQSHPSGDHNSPRPIWVSSCTGQSAELLGTDCLKGAYWGDNMCMPVLFSEAIDCALSSHGPYDMMVEIGPHPALQRPVSDTTEASLGRSDPIPYVGTLNRGKDDAEAFAHTLGFLWQTGIRVDFAAFDRAIYGNGNTAAPSAFRAPRLLKNLPTYCWDHNRVYAHDSRRARSFRTGTGHESDRVMSPASQLLGVRCLDETDSEYRFRNHLTARDFLWLGDHKIQGEVVLPASAYICAVVEAVVQIWPIDNVRLLELSDIAIRKAVIFPAVDGVSGRTGVETSLSINIRSETAEYIDASFSFSSCSDSDTISTKLTENCRGELRISRGSSPLEDECGGSLPPPRIPSLSSQLLSLEPATFYDWAHDLGYGYQGGFRGLCDIKRKLHESTGVIRAGVGDSSSFINPAALDCIIQAALLAYSCPGDGRMRSLHMPTKVDCLRIDLLACQDALVMTRKVSDDSTLKLPYYASVVPSFELIGDVEVHNSTGSRTLIQMQGLRATSLSPPSAENDVCLFFDMVFGPETPEGSSNDSFPELNQDQERFSKYKALCVAAERVAFFYLRRLGGSFSKDKRTRLQPYHQRLLDYADHCLEQVSNSAHPYAPHEWITDSEEEILAIIDAHLSVIDFRIIPAVGENLPEAIQSNGEVNILEAMTCDQMLTDYYSHGLGMPSYLTDLGRMVGQLGHRFPRMDILEIGAGTGAATTSILSNIEGNFRSYTYTDISSSFLQDAEAKFSSKYPSQMSFRTLDIETPVTEQGYTAASYDLIVASLTLHATKDLQASLANTRRLLRPGGYLVMLELTDADSLRVGLIFGGLPGWWLGSDSDGRRLSPCLPCDAWSDLLRKTGFSSIDAVTPSDKRLPVPLSVLICQAIDDRVEVLRDPLAHAHRLPRRQSLAIIGTSEVAECLRVTMAEHYERVTCFPTLAAVASTKVSIAGASVISLADAQPDQPAVFEHLADVDLQALQKILKECRAVLWVSWGCRAERPHANMFRGLQRSVALELSDTRVQTLDFEASDQVLPHLIATRLLQLEVYDIEDESGRMKDVLWHCEPEVFVEKGRILVPRLQQNYGRNQRYNSTRRFITRDVNVNDSFLTIRSDGICSQVVEEKPCPSGFFAEKIKLRHSMLKAVRIGSTTAFLSLGKSMDTGKSLIILSTSLDSYVQVLPGWTLPVHRSSEQGVEALLLLHAQLVARSLLVLATVGTKKTWLVVLDADLLLGEALVRLAALNGFRLTMFTTTVRKCSHPSVYLHPHETATGIRRLLPNVPFVFADMSTDENSQTSALIRRHLPRNCTQIGVKDLFSDFAEADASPHDIKNASDHLQAAWIQVGNLPANVRPLAESGCIKQFDLDDLTMNDAHSGVTVKTQTNQTLVSWESRETVRIQVKPASQQVQFAPDKTYWLAGLTGGLGLSTAQWMADRGARYIALSSRNPHVDSEWIHMMASRGCSVRVFTNDIVDRDSVQILYREMALTMPPIAGVAQGAMVLHDAVFPDLDITRLQKTLGPKVQGSLFLDELFPENTLDFFVFFSSMAYVVGNRGQSAYTAANAFIASLAARRRRRGLAGSVINIGGIVGEGYVSRQLAAGKQSALAKAGFEFMSEQAFHELFAEGILASPTAIGQDGFEISSGLRIGDSEGTSFASNPVFQFLVAKTSNLVDTSNSDLNTRSGITVKAQILEAATIVQLIEIIQNGLLAKLEATLHVELDPRRTWSMNPDQLGIDSLIAVDIQSWFRKELGVDLPVMKILNATSMDHLAHFARESIPIDRVPNLEAQEDKNNTSNTGLVDPSVSVDLKPNQPLEDEPVTAATGLGIAYRPQSSVDSSSVSGRMTPSTETRTNTWIGDASSTSTVDVWPTSSERLDIGLHFSRSVPMSFSQSRFWFLKFAVSDQTAFNVTTLIRLRGYVDAVKMSEALVAVGRRHEAIRTAFYVDAMTKEHMQGVLPRSPVYLECSTATGEDDIEAAVQEMQEHVFDLSRGLSLRLKLLSFGNNDHALVLGYHHIVMDGIGNQVFLSDLESAYQGHQLDTKFGDEDDMLQFPDFTLRQLREYEEGSWSKYLSYWRNQFRTLPPTLPLLSLSGRSGRPNTSTYRSHSVEARMGPALKLQIRQTCQGLKVTPFHFYLAVFGCLLFRYSQAEDICIGVADGNRRDHDVLRSLGLFLNLLPLRLRPDSQKTFLDALKDVKSISDDAFSNSRPPIDVLFNELHVPRSPSHAPLFQSFLNYRPHVSDSRPFCDCEAEGELVSGGQTAYDISLDILDSSSRDNRLLLSVNSGLYTTEDARLLQRSYLNLLQGFALDPSMELSRPNLHTEEDVYEGVQLGRGPEITRSQWPATVIHRIDEVVNTYGDRTALTDGNVDGQRLTYNQMAAFSDAISSHLLTLLEAKKEEEGTCYVGIFQTPGPIWICSFLGVLRAGATCVPFDRQIGLPRLLLIAQDCRPQIMLVDNTTKDENEFLQSTGTTVVNISDVLAKIRVGARALNSSISNRARPSGAAIVTYSSGSTGIPKGSVIQHAAYRNFTEFAPTDWALVEGEETVLQQSSYAFDLAIGEILVCLAYGGTLVIPDDTRRRDPAAICDLIAQEGVTFTIATPTEYLAWLSHDAIAGGHLLKGSRWRRAITAGEAVTSSLVREFSTISEHQPDFRLINVYGPSETTIGCAGGSINLFDTQHREPDEVVASVSPLPNYAITIVDSDLKPVPVGMLGQVLIRGAGVAERYLGRTELTMAAFVPDNYASPFFKSQGWSSAHLSGDRGRLDHSGRLHLHGRIHGSTQIKLGGVRMDLEDIENTVVTTMAPFVRQAVVSHRKSITPNASSGSGRSEYLVVFVVLSKAAWDSNEGDLQSEADGDSNHSSFLAELTSKLPLPHCMRPAVAVALDDIPTTINGKVDRAAVDAIPLTRHVLEKCSGEDENDVNSELDDFEKDLWRLWKEVLPEDILYRQSGPGGITIDREVDFFHIGGTSLSLITLQALIREKLDKRVSIERAFGASTLGQMAALLQDTDQIGVRSQDFNSINWDEEARVSPELLSLGEKWKPPGTQSIPISRPFLSDGSAVVVLTGSTGFLGKEILHQLLLNPIISRVHCIAVRKPLSELPEDLFTSSKVTTYQGNLSTAQLGLSDHDAAEIFTSTDAVIHCGANVSFMETYHSLRLPNVTATKELVRLSLLYAVKAPLFHFVSTASATRLSGLDAYGPTSLRPYQPDRDGSDGYVSSKWASEMFLENAATLLGLPVVVHRPSSIMGVGAPENDLLGNLLRYAVETMTVPDVSSWSGCLDFVRVENVAQILISEVMEGIKERDLGDPGVRSVPTRYVYESGDVVIALDQLAEAVQTTARTDDEHTPAQVVSILPMAEWINVIEQSGMHPLLVAYLRSLKEDVRFLFPTLYRDKMLDGKLYN